jgi:indole-3-glycerol phosphate synthase
MNNRNIPKLDTIVASVRNDLEERKKTVSIADLERRAARKAAPRNLRTRLGDRTGIIGEIKRASPSQGWIRQELDAAGTARVYEEAGVCAVSVLTDRRFFGGSLSDLDSVSGATGEAPILRKDFLLDEYMLLESRAHGADLVLLIAAVLGKDTRAMVRMANGYGLASLVEVHDESELAIAVDAGAGIIGINNRDLTTFTVDLGTSERLLPRIPAGAIKVVESGIRSPSDLRRLAGQGADLFLIGEALVRSEDPARTIREFLREAIPEERHKEEAEWK